jgi:hypothetical protein
VNIKGGNYFSNTQLIQKIKGSDFRATQFDRRYESGAYFTFREPEGFIKAGMHFASSYLATQQHNASFMSLLRLQAAVTSVG